MPRIAYVNGRIVPLAEAAVSVEDRGYQFADGVYEVCAVLGGQLLDWPGHLERLARSRELIEVSAPMSDAALTIVARRLIAINGLKDALLYIQLTRGVARRDHGFPASGRPSLVMTVRPFDFDQRVRQQTTGVAVASRADDRWDHCDIKSIALLPNVLAKQAARRAGAFETWFVDAQGNVTEGASTNAWIVDAAGTVVTRPLSPAILPGVMRATLIRLAEAAQIKIEQRSFSLDEAKAAPEAFITSTTAPCLAVTAIDGEPVADGKPGPVTRRLGELLWAEIASQTGFTGPR